MLKLEMAGCRPASTLLLGTRGLRDLQASQYKTGSPCPTARKLKSGNLEEQEELIVHPCATPRALLSPAMSESALNHVDNGPAHPK